VLTDGEPDGVDETKGFLCLREVSALETVGDLVEHFCGSRRSLVPASLILYARTTSHILRFTSRGRLAGRSSELASDRNAT
jgi:hypothetical protein